MRLLISLLIFWLPLVIFPFGTSPFEIPKVIVAQVSIEVLFLAWLYKKRWNFKKIFDLEKLPFQGLIILSLIHLIFLGRETSFFGNIFRLQGIFLLWHLILFSYISSSIKIYQGKKFIFIPAILLSILSFVFSVDKAGRFMLSLGEPNAFASVLVFSTHFYSSHLNAKNQKSGKLFYFCGYLPLFFFRAHDLG